MALDVSSIPEIRTIPYVVRVTAKFRIGKWVNQKEPACQHIAYDTAMTLCNAISINEVTAPVQTTNVAFRSCLALWRYMYAPLKYMHPKIVGNAGLLSVIVV